jgi:ubiquinone/menaquinone biosynthesis C-methylase UbiE
MLGHPFMKREPRNYGQIDESSSLHQEHIERMIKYYDQTASNYNTWHCDPNNESSHNFAVREILQTMRDLKAASLLDVCCGTGRAIRAALDNGYIATGIDASPSLIEIGCRELSIPKECFIVGDATNLPFQDNSFDVSCILGALHHTAQPRRIVTEMVRVTKKAIIVSDQANNLSGGIKHLLISLGLFDPIYRLIFRRKPRTHRRQGMSDSDGPTFDFSIEEIMPILRQNFSEFRCFTFYRVGSHQFASYRFPRLFANQGVITVINKCAS